MIRWLVILGVASLVGAQTMDDARRLHGEGAEAYARGDLATAEARWRASLAIVEAQAPDSPTLAGLLSNLGVVASDRGDLEAAAEAYARALVILERQMPDSEPLASILMNLGNLATERGQLDSADGYLRRALAIVERLATDSPDVAIISNELGNVADLRGDLDAAEGHYRRAVAIFERVAPESREVAACLSNLGLIVRGRGDAAGARELHQRALTIFERLGTDPINQAQTLVNLGAIAHQLGELDAAEEQFARALALHEQIAPGSLPVATVLGNLGVVARERGDRARAATLGQAALAIRERLAPDSLDLAASLRNLAVLAVDAGDAPAALAAAERAADLVEHQRARLAGGESRALLTAAQADVCRVLLDAHLLAGDVPGAFAALERSRARSLADALAERHLDFDRDAPTELRDRQASLDAALAAAHGELASLDPRERAERIDQLGATIRGLSAQQRELEGEIRRASPAYAALRYPEPLDTAAAQAALDPGTLLLAYQLDEHESHLFAVTRQSIEHVRLDWSEAVVRDKVTEFRRLCSRAGGDPAAAGRELYDQLLRPAQAVIDSAERLLLCADGPLGSLPFAALVTSPAGEPPRYLVEARPLHSVASVTVYRALHEREAAADRPPTLLALGAPDGLDSSAGTTLAANREQRQALERLGPLRFAAEEVTAVGELFGAGATVRLGPRASEAGLKAEPIDADVLHVACHGLYFEDHPLDSALVLAPGGGDDGLLQVWEILESLRLRAALVVLSACETGLGTEQRFEGLLGLTRAFQHAGARRVVVSHWQVSDESTVALMTELHRRRAAGDSTDQALRAAQLSLLRSDRRIAGRPIAHPFFWAAFALTGDWR